MSAPTTVRIDWSNAGAFGTTPFDTVAPLTDDRLGIRIITGRSADAGAGEALGSIEFELENDDDAYTEERQWVDNPSLEWSTDGWSVAAIPGLLAAGTSISRVADHAPVSTGAWAGSAVLPATLHAGVAFALPWPFARSRVHAFSIALKLASGATGVECGLASAGTPADIAVAAGTITNGWIVYSGTFTPSARRDDVVLFIRTTAAAAATVRFDAAQVNAGSSPRPFLEAPSRGQLVKGRPVHAYVTVAGVDKPRFFGRIDRIQPDPAKGRRTVRITAYSPLKSPLDEIAVYVPAFPFVQRSARDMRVAILEDAARGNRNLLPNPAFGNGGTTPWSTNTSTLTRITTDVPPGAAAAARWVWSSGTAWLTIAATRIPNALAGQLYHASVYLKSESGSTAVTLRVLGSGGTPVATKLVTITGEWRRYDLVGQADADILGYAGSVGFRLEVGAAASILVGNAAMTRGAELYPYDDVGAGRWTNFVANGSFDGGARNGWVEAWSNLIPNGGFEVGVSGWSTAPDSFHGAAASLVRSTGSPKFGVGCGVFTAGGASGGIHIATPAVVGGVRYDWSAWALQSSGANLALEAGVGSNGTPTDKGVAGGVLIASGVWTQVSGSWTPAANRSDAHFFVYDIGGSATPISVDGVILTRRDASQIASGASASYSETGPGGGGSFPTSFALSSAHARFGRNSLAVTTPATAGAGTMYDFNHAGALFAGLDPIILRISLFATDAMPYRIGLGANAGDGTWDEHTVTGTLTPNAWNDIDVPWTPTAQRVAAAYSSGLFVYQTDATARTFYVDAVRVVPGATAEAAELDEWSGLAVDEADDQLLSAALSGSALSLLAQLNRHEGSRHWTEFLMTAPYWRYVVESRQAYPTKSVVATWYGRPAEGAGPYVDEFGPLDRASESYANTVTAVWSNGSDTISDAESVKRHGPMVAATVGSAALYADATVPRAVAASIVDRFRFGAVRPDAKLVNEWSVLDRQLSDVVAATIDRYLLADSRWAILRIELLIHSGSLGLEATIVLEAYPY